ncbi:mediator of RNA polymerase II transcription subunit 7, putative [Plasmodium chabaudi chabaudi]|uniref:Mediator of RNA polymerase II transcription subunit 7 n=1 Tax=Plasmodium chabaudi chabaudi TaxID=31271 RepID=A0A1D3LDH1_PLACU|nr:mediator of RNA polymerase II transcription subunit 7, putative [Plasmodium chabaudi chabaudi]
MENFVSGYPPPPYYFHEYEEADTEVDSILEKHNNNINNTQNSFINIVREAYDIYNINDNIKVGIDKTDKNNIDEKEATATLEKINHEDEKAKCKFLFGRPPPIPLKDNYNIFGINYDTDRKVEELEADDILYDNKKNYKEEFIRLYKMYKDCFFSLFDDIVNTRKNDKTLIKQLIKIHTNLFHILANLRYHQTINNIINILKIQIKRRQIAIDKMKISLFNVYNYIDFVQTNFSKNNMIKNERNVLKRKNNTHTHTENENEEE